MKNLLIQQIVPILITCVIAIIAAVIKAVGDAIVAFINTKKEEVIKRIGQSEYDSKLKIAKNIWDIVEEHFRINRSLQNVTTNKIELFNKLLLERVPGLTQSEIDYLRQSIAGDVNRWKDELSDTTKNTSTVSEHNAIDVPKVNQ